MGKCSIMDGQNSIEILVAHIRFFCKDFGRIKLLSLGEITLNSA